jgi:hypothetical protein
MRTMLVLLIPLVLIGCRPQTHEMTPQEKETAKREIAGILDSIVRACNQLDCQKALMPYSDSPDFMGVNTDGSVCDFDALRDNNTALFNAVSSFTFTTTKVDFHFIGDKSVLCTWIGSSEIILKTGEHVRTPTLVSTLLFSRLSDEWKITYSHQSASPLIFVR